MMMTIAVKVKLFFRIRRILYVKVPQIMFEPCQV